MVTKTTGANQASFESALEQMIQPEPPEEREEEGTEEEGSSTDPKAQEPEADPEDNQEDDQEDDESEEDRDDDDRDDEDPEDDSDEDSDEAGAKLYTVKVDGEERKVSIDDLKRGYSGQEYVQKGMKEAANARKQAEAAHEQLQKTRREMVQFFQAVQQEGITPPPPEPDRSQFHNDPIGYMEAKIAHDEAVGEYEKKTGSIKQMMQQQSEAERQAMQQYAEQEYRQLVALEPEWGSKDTAVKRRDRMLEGGAKFYGYTAEEIGEVMDHRAIRVLEDAVAYRQLKSGKSRTKDEVTERANRSKVTRSKSRRRQDPAKKAQQAKKQRLKRTGSITDAVDLMFDPT